MVQQTPLLKIPDFQLEVREFFNEFRDKVKSLQETFNTYSSVVIGVLLLGFLVLLFALATLLIQSWQFTTTFNNESNQLKIQQDLIQNTVDEQKAIIKSQQDMKKELDEIKNMLPTKSS